MNTPKIYAAEEVKAATRKSPAKAIVEQINAESDVTYMTVTEVADHLGVHQETIRRLTKAVDAHGEKKVKAPTYATQVGEMVIYLFSPDDISELEEYFAAKNMPRKLA